MKYRIKNLKNHYELLYLAIHIIKKTIRTKLNEQIRRDSK